MLMRIELEEQLRKDFPFLEKSRSAAGQGSAYARWGIECANGWYELIRDLCTAIAKVYESYERPADIVLVQIKQKFATLRFLL